MNQLTANRDGTVPTGELCQWLCCIECCDDIFTLGIAADVIGIEILPGSDPIDDVSDVSMPCGFQSYFLYLIQH